MCSTHTHCFCTRKKPWNFLNLLCSLPTLLGISSWNSLRCFRAQLYNNKASEPVRINLFPHQTHLQPSFQSGSLGFVYKHHRRLLGEKGEVGGKERGTHKEPWKLIYCLKPPQELQENKELLQKAPHLRAPRSLGGFKSNLTSINLK